MNRFSQRVDLPLRAVYLRQPNSGMQLQHVDGPTEIQSLPPE